MDWGSFLLKKRRVAIVAIMAAVCLPFIEVESNLEKEPLLLCVDRVMPSCLGQTLSGCRIELPDRSYLNPQILIIGFSWNAKEQGKKWANVLAQESFLPGSFRFYAVGIVKESFLYQTFKPFIIKTLKTIIPQKAHGQVLICSQGEPALRQWLKAEKGSCSQEAYVVLLNHEGIAEWVHKGPPTSSAKKALKAAYIKLF